MEWAVVLVLWGLADESLELALSLGKLYLGHSKLGEPGGSNEIGEDGGCLTEFLNLAGDRNVGVVNLGLDIQQVVRSFGELADY